MGDLVYEWIWVPLPSQGLDLVSFILIPTFSLGLQFQQFESTTAISNLHNLSLAKDFALSDTYRTSLQDTIFVDFPKSHIPF